MKIEAVILGIVILFVVYEIGYSIGYRNCGEYIQEIIDDMEDNDNEM